jgi:hypothetical protein
VSGEIRNAEKWSREIIISKYFVHCLLSAWLKVVANVITRMEQFRFAGSRNTNNISLSLFFLTADCGYWNMLVRDGLWVTADSWRCTGMTKFRSDNSLPASNLCHTTDTHVSNMFCHTLLTTNVFRSLLLSSSSGQLYSSTNNTTNYQIMSVEPLKDTINVSNSPYGHRMSADVLFDTGKM